ncbi:MAG TPA: hypothetical protein VHI93_00245, partial [Candidatus Thermoplasmatota archaeon]|nr:hypothetical protein [Candidatus Thermoplasmatota archaeon]
MEVDRRLEELCERVTLIDGVGSRRRGELCVMSFVALLGGERHTDHPASASPLIRNLAIPVNDAMPQDLRQRLKPFAARIVGTNDGRDPARAELLRQALAREILPRIRHDWGVGRVMERYLPLLGPLLLGSMGLAGPLGLGSEERMALLLAQLERGTPPGYEPCLGSAVGELLARCLREASTREQRGWYCDQAIGLLDRLCDVGPEPRRRDMRSERITRAEQRLGGTWLSSLRRLVPTLSRAGQ